MNEDERKTLMGEQNIVAPKTELEGREVFQTEFGQFSRHYKLFCDVCGIKVEENSVIICQEKQHKTCSDCSVRFDQKNVCVDCLKEKVKLSKQQFKILASIFSGISWTRGLHAVTHMPKSVIQKILSELIQAEYVQKRRIFWLEITDTGMDVLVAYRTVYPKDRDVENLNWELRRRE